VNRAGTSLTEIMDSIKRVVEIVAEIASASGEQATGIDQVNIALTQMDEVTQQNSALVEQNAAAAKSLEEQSHAMNVRVSFFRVADARAGGKARASAVAVKRSVAA
jgi:methyl-accepting chemotaxis protein